MMLLRNPFRLDRATIGTRLTACFVAIVLSMIAADAIAMWQFSRTSAPARRLTQADQNSLSVARVHLDCTILSETTWPNWRARMTFASSRRRPPY